MMGEGREADNFLIVNVPKSQDGTLDRQYASILAPKFRDLRLYSLRESPDAFASNYHEEAQRSIEQSVERLRNPKADHFFLVRNHVGPQHLEANQPTIEKLAATDWLGMVVLIGPVVPNTSSGQSTISATANPLSSASASMNEQERAGKEKRSTERYFHLNGTYIHPEARGRGFARALMEAAMRKGFEKSATDVETIRYTVLVNRDNPGARRLYESSGFQVVGEETYMQRTWSQGQCLEVPRVALHMEAVRRRAASL